MERPEDDRTQPLWPATIPELEAMQLHLATAAPPPWHFPGDGETLLRGARPGAGLAPGLVIGGCFVCFGRDSGGPGAAGDPGWAAAVCWADGSLRSSVAVSGQAGAPYDAGHLALREGPLLEAAVRALPEPPEVLLVNSTGRDHPRGAGMALHLGAQLGLPTVGVTNRLLLATGDPPADALHECTAFECAGAITGWWVRTRAATRPLAVHAAWRTDARTALAVVLACTLRNRTPEPLRLARRTAREARARAGPAGAGAVRL